jgi:hypothetical protein
MIHESYKNMRFEVLIAVKMSMLVFWVVMPCEFVGRYQRFRPSMFLQNVGIFLQIHTALQPGRPISTIIQDI